MTKADKRVGKSYAEHAAGKSGQVHMEKDNKA